jgi:hypothetical protein
MMHRIQTDVDKREWGWDSDYGNDVVSIQHAKGTGGDDDERKVQMTKENGSRLTGGKEHFGPLCIPHQDVDWASSIGIVMCLTRLIITTEELLEGTEINDSENPLCWPRDTLYPQNLAITSPTSGSRSVGIVRSRTKATEFSFSLSCHLSTLTLLQCCCHTKSHRIYRIHNYIFKLHFTTGLKWKRSGKVKLYFC